MSLEVIVQAVATQAAQQGDILGLCLGDVADIDASGVALVLDIQAELGLLDVRGQIVDVLHHQLPVGLLRIVRCILQGLHKEGLAGIRMFGSKLTHLEGTATRGELIGYGQHLVCLEGGLQRDISQRLIDCVLRTVQQTGGREFLVVCSTLVFSCQHRTCLVNVTSGDIGRGELLIL